MQEALTVYVPEEIRLMLNRTREELSRDLRLNSALMFFWLGKLSSGAAAELAGIPRVMPISTGRSTSPSGRANHRRRASTLPGS